MTSRRPSNPLGSSDLNTMATVIPPITTSTPLRAVEGRKVSRPIVLVDSFSVALGKRQRDSTGSNTTGIIDADTVKDVGSQDMLRSVVRHSKKRARREEDDAKGIEETQTLEVVSNPSTKPSGARSNSSSLEPLPQTPRNAIPPISNSPPPTAHLPEFFESSYQGPLDESSQGPEISVVERSPLKASSALPAFPFLAPTAFLDMPDINNGLEMYSPGALAYAYEDPLLPENNSTPSRPCTPPRPENLHSLWARGLVLGQETTIPSDPMAFYLESPIRPRDPSPPPQFVDFTGIGSLIPPSFPSWYETAEAQSLEPLSIRPSY